MANLTITLTGTASEKSVEIEAGETIRIGATWQNADGTPRSMDGASVNLVVYRKSGTAYTQIASVAQPDTSYLYVPAATTDAWVPGTYHLEAVETRAPDVNIGSFTVTVRP